MINNYINFILHLIDPFICHLVTLVQMNFLPIKFLIGIIFLFLLGKMAQKTLFLYRPLLLFQIPTFSFALYSGFCLFTVTFAIGVQSQLVSLLDGNLMQTFYFFTGVLTLFSILWFSVYSRSLLHYFKYLTVIFIFTVSIIFIKILATSFLNSLQSLIVLNSLELLVLSSVFYFFVGLGILLLFPRFFVRLIVYSYCNVILGGFTNRSVFCVGLLLGISLRVLIVTLLASFSLAVVVLELPRDEEQCSEALLCVTVDIESVKEKIFDFFNFFKLKNSLFSNYYYHEVPFYSTLGEESGIRPNSPQLIGTTLFMMGRGIRSIGAKTPGGASSVLPISNQRSTICFLVDRKSIDPSDSEATKTLGHALQADDQEYQQALQSGDPNAPVTLYSLTSAEKLKIKEPDPTPLDPNNTKVTTYTNEHLPSPPNYSGNPNKDQYMGSQPIEASIQVINKYMKVHSLADPYENQNQAAFDAARARLENRPADKLAPGKEIEDKGKKVKLVDKKP